MQADVLILQSKIFEEARGFATHPDLGGLRSKLAKQAVVLRWGAGAALAVMGLRKKEMGDNGRCQC